MVLLNSTRQNKQTKITFLFYLQETFVPYTLKTGTLRRLHVSVSQVLEVVGADALVCIGGQNCSAVAHTP